MPKQNIGPRIEPTTKQFYSDTFESVNAGAEYILESFPVLYRRTMLGLKGRFTRSEIMLMLDVMNGTWLAPGIAGQCLPANCADGIAFDGLDRKWEIEAESFLAKIHALSLWECSCLEVWCRTFWKKCPDEKIDEWVGRLASS